MEATNPLSVPELLGLVLTAVDSVTLQRCFCVNRTWFERSVFEIPRRLKWLREVHPESRAFSYSLQKPEEGTEVEKTKEVWEVSRWWMRLHGELIQFIENKAALQFLYNSSDGFLIFRDVERPFFNTLTKTDSFGVRTKPVLMSLNLSLLWWEDIDEILKSCCVFKGIFAYTGSVKPFTRDDIAQVLALNAAWYLYSFDERGTLAIFVLKDGRFVFFCEGTSTGTIESAAQIYSKCIFASSLHLLLFFALDDMDRIDLGINIGDMSNQQKPKRNIEDLHESKKKYKEHFSQRTSAEPEVLEPFMVYPRRRVQAHMKLLGVTPVRVSNYPAAPTEYPYIDFALTKADQSPSLLWYDSWEGERKEANQKFFDDWQNVWQGSGGYHCSLSWLRGGDEEDEEEVNDNPD